MQDPSVGVSAEDGENAAVLAAEKAVKLATAKADRAQKKAQRLPEEVDAAKQKMANLTWRLTAKPILRKASQRRRPGSKNLSNLTVLLLQSSPRVVRVVRVARVVMSGEGGDEW